MLLGRPSVSLFLFGLEEARYWHLPTMCLESLLEYCVLNIAQCQAQFDPDLNRRDTYPAFYIFPALVATG